MQPTSSVPTIQPRKTGHRRKIEPMPDAFAIRSTKGRARSNRRLQQAANEEEEVEAAPVQETAEDDFFGISASSQKPRERKHVDADFEDFEISTSVPTQRKQETAGSFWDDNEGEEEEEKKDDFWESSGPQKKKKEPEAVDRFLDGIGDMLSIKISEDVHTNVKSWTSRME